MIYKTSKINKQLLKLEFGIDSDIVLNDKKGYIVNHTLKKICGPYKDIHRTIDESFAICFRANKKTSMIDLITHKDSYVIQHDIPEYVHITKTGKEYSRPYKTNSQEIFIQQAGIYCIENKTTNTIYIGETILSFHDRWCKHCKFPSTKKLKELITHPDTIFRILEITSKDKAYTEERELHYIDYYKENTNYEVLGGNFRLNRKNQ